MKRTRAGMKTLLLAALAGGLLYLALGGESRADLGGEHYAWQPRYEGKITKSTLRDLTGKASDFLTDLGKKDSGAATQGLLDTIYALEKQDHQNFINSMAALIKTRGKPVNHNFVQVRTLDNTKRYYIVSFLSYHGAADITGWEFDFVKVSDKWKIRDIRWDSNAPYQFLTRRDRPGAGE